MCIKETPTQIQPPNRGPGKMIFARLTLPETWKDVARMLREKNRSERITRNRRARDHSGSVSKRTHGQSLQQLTRESRNTGGPDHRPLRMNTNRALAYGSYRFVSCALFARCCFESEKIKNVDITV